MSEHPTLSPLLLHVSLHTRTTHTEMAADLLNTTQNAPNPEGEDKEDLLSEEQQQNEEEEEEEEESESEESDSDESTESETESYVPRDAPDIDSDEDESNNNPESNIKRFTRILNSKRLKREEEAEEKDYTYHEDLFNFPKDVENWREEDLKELWGDAPIEMTKPGWDPNWVDEEEMEIVEKEIKAGRDPPIAPFYVPYRKPYPVIPDNHYDISTPKAVIEELDRIEEFLTWVSYIFPDGSS